MTDYYIRCHSRGKGSLTNKCEESDVSTRKRRCLHTSLSQLDVICLAPPNSCCCDSPAMIVCSLELQVTTAGESSTHAH